MTISELSPEPHSRTPLRGAMRKAIFPFRGREIGGSHVSAFTLAEALAHGHGVECVIVVADDTPIANEARRRGLRVIAASEQVNARENPLEDLRRRAARRDFLSSVSDGREALVHCNNLSTLSAWGGAARALGMPVVYHHRSLARLWLPHRAASLARASAVITISDATLNNARGVRPDAVKVFNPFNLNLEADHSVLKHALTEEFAWPREARVIGWVGNFWARKRPQFFLEVAAQLSRLMPDCRFVLFGRDGDVAEAELRQEVVRHGLSNIAAFAGFRMPIEHNIASLDLLLAPALHEPFGRTLVEAIVLGVPIVATRSAGHEEILRTWGGGIAFDEAATPEVVAKLCRDALTAPDQVRLQPRERDAVARTLSPANHAAAVMDVYQACCDA